MVWHAREEGSGSRLRVLLIQGTMYIWDYDKAC